MKIGELAKSAGCKVVTVRYYEKEGLLPAPERSGGNYRVYSAQDVERLEFILRCRDLGIGLEDLRSLLLFRDKPRQDCTWLSQFISARIQDVDTQIASLEHLRGHLETLRQSCAGKHSGETCGIMRQLEEGLPCCASCARFFSKGTKRA